jgi:2-succinyl-5-enolpyruvyl-6-hydroxy-3-cyclohexene-1-carboxylate synthase
MTTVDELRDVLQGQRTRVADLRERIQSKYLRDCLASAAGVLDMVKLSISAATMAEPSFASSRAWWLQQTEKLLGGASAQIDFVDDYVRKFGDDVTSFPS